MFVILFAVVWLPLIQEQVGFFTECQLKGAFVKPVRPQFSIDSVNELKFQKQFEDYQNFNFGLRGFLVKIRNSVEYILYRELSNKNYIVGKDNFIFDIYKIENTLGLRYNRKEKTEDAVKKIKFLQEGLENHGVKVMCMLVPSKEKAISEYLPSYYKNMLRSETTYGDFAQGLKKFNIPTLDYCLFFDKIKGPTPYPLFTKSGVHWSMFGASLAQDTLLKWIQKAVGKPIPGYRRNGVELSDTARIDDNDNEWALNLFFSLGQSKYLYPKLEMIESTKKNYRPKVIVIGDSFIWQFRNLKMVGQIFSPDSKFLHYFGETYAPFDDQQFGKKEKLDVMRELESADIVILEGSIGTIDIYPFGVAEYYYNNVTKPEVVEYVRKYVATNPTVLEGLKKRNAPKSIDELVFDEAKRMCRDRQTFTLKAANDKFISAGGDGDKELVATEMRQLIGKHFPYCVCKMGK